VSASALLFTSRSHDSPFVALGLLVNPPTGLNRAIHQPGSATLLRPSCRNHPCWFRNINLIPITYAFRPRLTSTNDLVPPRRMGLIVTMTPRRDTIVPPAHEVNETVAVHLRTQGPAYRCLQTRRHIRYRYISRRDSDLEAFSRKPSDGSFAPAASQPST